MREQPLLVPTVAVGVVLLLAAVPGGGIFLAAVVCTALVGLVVLQAAFASTGQRPVFLAAAVAGVAGPLRAAANPDAGLNAGAAAVAVSLLLAFVLLIVGPRRTGVALAVGATVMCAVVVGFGGAALVALRSTDGGFRWTAATLLLTAVPEVVAEVAQRLRPADATVAGTGRVLAIGVLSGALLAVANPPLGLVALVALAGAAGLAALGATAFCQAVTLEVAGPSHHLGAAAPLRWLLAVLLVAPVAVVIASALQA